MPDTFTHLDNLQSLVMFSPGLCVPHDADAACVSKNTFATIRNQQSGEPVPKSFHRRNETRPYNLRFSNCKCYF